MGATALSCARRRARTRGDRGVAAWNPRRLGRRKAQAGLHDAATAAVCVAARWQCGADRVREPPRYTHMLHGTQIKKIARFNTPLINAPKQTLLERAPSWRRTARQTPREKYESALAGRAPRCHGAPLFMVVVVYAMFVFHGMSNATPTQTVPRIASVTCRLPVQNLAQAARIDSGTPSGAPCWRALRRSAPFACSPQRR